jgi:hypothetical protein
MGSQYMRLRAAVVLIALMGVPAAAILGTWGRWSRHGPPPVPASPSHAPDGTGYAQQTPAVPEQPGDPPNVGTENRSKPTQAATRPSIRHRPSDKPSAPKATIRGVLATAPAEPTPGSEPADPDAVASQALGQAWREAQERLAALGAINWRLENWGSEGLYRFSCAVSLAGGSRSTRYFEAVAPRAEVAIERVLSEVEAFRAGQPVTTAGRQPLRR